MQNYQYYISFNDNSFNGFNIILDGETLPNNAVIITTEQHEQYLTALNSQLKNIILVDGIIQIVDKYTSAELVAQAAEQAVNQLRFEAERLHEETTEAMASDMLATFTTPEQIELTNYRIDLRLAINDPSNNPLPAKPTWLAEWLTQ